MFQENLQSILNDFNNNPYCSVNIDIDKIIKDLEEKKPSIAINIDVKNNNDETDTQNITFELFNYTINHSYSLQAVDVVDNYEKDLPFIVKNGYSKAIGNNNSFPLITSTFNNGKFVKNNIPNNENTTTLFIIRNINAFWALAIAISSGLFDYQMEEKKKSLMQ